MDGFAGGVFGVARHQHPGAKRSTAGTRRYEHRNRKTPEYVSSELGINEPDRTKFWP